MFTRLLAGPSAGVSRAALEVAHKLGLESGGYIHAEWEKEGVAQDDAAQFEARFGLHCLDGQTQAAAVRRMVLEADGTLVIFCGDPGREGRQAIDHCRQLGCTRLLLDIQRQSAFSASQELAAWQEIHQVGTLFVTGSTEVECAGIQHKTAGILEAAFFLVMADTGLSRPLHGPQSHSGPAARRQSSTVDEVIDQLSEVLSLRDRIRIARLKPTELASLNISLGQYIRKNFGLGESPEDHLLTLCRTQSGRPEMAVEDAISYLIRCLWETLTETHTLRRVK
jgi:hypothetical protein